MNAQIRQRIDFEDAGGTAYLDDWKKYVMAHRGLEHPFLEFFIGNALAPQDLRRAFLEFYYFIHHLPFYIAGMALTTRDEKILREIAINVAEEVGERDKTPHLQIYREFLAGIGVTSQDVAYYDCLDSTRNIDRGVETLYTKVPIEKALGAMYALESMSSAMVEKLNRGLEHAGVNEGVRRFFIEHIEGEKGHSNGAFNAIFPYLAVPANRTLFEEGVKEFMKLIEQFWDGVDSVCRRH